MGEPSWNLGCSEQSLALTLPNQQGRIARVMIPEPPGTVLASGSVGPFRTNDYGATPLSGTYSLQNADLSLVHGISGHGSASGRYSGTFSGIEIVPHLSE
jgi:hypothetical protein